MRIALLAAVAFAALSSPAAAEDPPTFHFRSPDNKVHCLWNDEAGMNCQVSWSTVGRHFPEQECGSGHFFMLERTGRMGYGCNMGDSLRNDSFPVFAWDTQQTHAGITCTMKRAGLRCANRAGHGFVLGNGRVQVF